MPERRTLSRWVGGIPSWLWNPRIESPIFVIGCPRSGTTLLVNLLALHPDLCNLSEGAEIWAPEDFDDPQVDHVWTADAATDARIDALHRRFEFFRQRAGGGRLLNKRPRSSVRLPFLHRAFPDATILHILRDGRAVVRSLMKRIEGEPERKHLPYGGFCKPANWRDHVDDAPLRRCALQWRDIVLQARRDATLFAPRLLELRYEGLCRRPRDTVERLWKFLGLQHCPEALEGIPPFFENRSRNVFADWEETALDETTKLLGELLKELGYLDGHGETLPAIVDEISTSERCDS